MSNEDKKPAPPRGIQSPIAASEAARGKPPSPPSLGDVLESLATSKRAPDDYTPVALARFSRPIQYPGRQSDPQVKTERMGNGQSWEVEYLHDLRHMRITFSDPARKVIKVGYVPIEQVLSWDPLT